MMPLTKPWRRMRVRMPPSAPPLKSTPCDKMTAALPVHFRLLSMCSRKAWSPFFSRGAPYSNWPNSSSAGFRPLIQFLFENGGLAATKSKVLKVSSAALKRGLARVLACSIFVVVQRWGIRAAPCLCGPGRWWPRPSLARMGGLAKVNHMRHGAGHFKRHVKLASAFA